MHDLDWEAMCPQVSLSGGSVYLRQSCNTHQVIARGSQCNAGIDGAGDCRDTAPELIVEGKPKLSQSLVIF